MQASVQGIRELAETIQQESEIVVIILTTCAAALGCKNLGGERVVRLLKRSR